MSTKNCPSCGAPVALNTTECKYCGEEFSFAPPPNPQMHQNVPRETQQPFVNNNIYVNSAPPPQQVWVRPAKSKIVAGILAILLGGFGIHKFYLGRVGWGIVYLLFCWTYIPTLISLVEGIIYFASSDESFNMKYGTKTF
ncbi:NINE protein [Paenibacillus sp. OAS669]|uniref:NINE protein n=1 Tax=Paenibacillus sp. OAS669 TaxID=2663821 RepID=UPI00178BE376|nr:TM2 domain-containing membrane protein YozV [Paenibacillus sp. OAS669]